MKKLKFVSPILLPIFAVIFILITGCSNSVAIAQNTRLEDMMKTFYTKEEKKSVKDQIKTDLFDMHDVSLRLYSETISEFSSLCAELSDLKSLYHEYGIESKEIERDLSALYKNFNTTIKLIETIQAVQKGNIKPVEFQIYEKN